MEIKSINVGGTIVAKETVQAVYDEMIRRSNIGSGFTAGEMTKFAIELGVPERTAGRHIFSNNMPANRVVDRLIQRARKANEIISSMRYRAGALIWSGV